MGGTFDVTFLVLFNNQMRFMAWKKEKKMEVGLVNVSHPKLFTSTVSFQLYRSGVI